MGVALWGPLLAPDTHAVTLFLEADLGVLDDQYQPNAVGIGLVGELEVQADPTWTDLSDRITKAGLTIGARFERSTQGFTGWTLSGKLRNDDGDLSRHNSQSPYYLPGIGSTIKAGTPVRLRGTYDNGSTVRDFTLFTGFLETWNPTYEASGYDPQIVLEASDAFAGLAGFDGFEQTPAGAGESAGARVARVLDNAGHVGPRALADGQHTMQATTLAQNALAEAKLTADSEGGPFYSDPSGRIILEDRDSLATLDRSIEVQVTFADDDTPGALRYRADGVEPRYDQRLWITDAAYTRTGGTTQVASSSDARSLARRIIQDRRTDLVCETDAQALALAKRAVAVRKEVRERLDGLTFDPDAQMVDGVVDPTLQAAAWEAITSGRLGLLSLVRTVYTPIQPPVGSIDTFDDVEHVRGITHTITLDGWSVDLEFSAAAVWVAASQSRIGLGVVGELVVWT